MNFFGNNAAPSDARKSARSADEAAEPPRQGRFLGSLRDALAAASRNDAGVVTAPPVDIVEPSPALPPALPAIALPSAPISDAISSAPEPAPIAAPVQDNSGLPAAEEVTLHLDRARAAGAPRPLPARTELVRGRNPIPRGDFRQDPVVGWLVVVGGLGLGSFRPVFEGNNSIGRARSQRIAIDFGDDAISNEEQAYIRYDGNDRTFLFVPNMSKTNVVSVNNKKPTSAVPLNPMDVITMGRTQLAFVPFCGPEFDWSEI